MNDTANHNSPGGQDADEISLLDLLQTVADHLRLLTLGPLAVGVTALGISAAIPPTYTATAKFLPPPSAGADRKTQADKYVAYLRGNGVQDALIERFQLQERYHQKHQGATRQALAAKARITAGKDGIVTIEVDDKEAQVSADLANAHIEELQSRVVETPAQKNRLFLEKQLSQTRDRLTQAEQAVRSSGVNASALQSAAVTALAQLQAQVMAQEVKVAGLRSLATESAPADLQQATTELGTLRAQLGKLKSSYAGDDMARYREFKYQEALLELFSQQYELAKLEEAREGAVIQVLDAAQPPESKSKPKKGLIAVLATLGSGFALLLFVFVRQALRNACQSPESAEKLKRLKASFRRSLGFKS